MSRTQLSIIVYQPGFGGHFLEYLFSLDPSIAPHIPDGCTSNLDTIEERLSTWSFGRTKKLDHWLEFHNLFVTADTLKLIGKYPKMVIACHPYEFRHHYEFEKTSSLLSPKFYIATLSNSDFTNFWLMRSKEKWNQKPILRRGEILDEQEIIKALSTTEISIDKIIDAEQWEEEYLRICLSMQIPAHLELARPFYQEWYNLRVLPLVEEFRLLSKDQVEKYNSKRYRDDYVGLLSHEKDMLVNRWYHWTRFYETIRTDDWPDCDNEWDFHLLPGWIQKEIIEKFEYYPKHHVDKLNVRTAWQNNFGCSLPEPND